MQRRRFRNSGGRSLVLFGAVALSGLTLAAPVVGQPHTPGRGGTCAPGVSVLGFSDALDKTRFHGTDVGGLSALTPTGGRQTYRTVLDNQDAASARIYTVRIPQSRDTLGTPRTTGVTTLRDRAGKPFDDSNFDGEGLAQTRRGTLLVSSETEPTIRRFAPDGALLGELPVPQRFRVRPAGQAEQNATFESLTLSPSGHSLFTAVESPLSADGSTADGHERLRVLRYAERKHGGYAPAQQFYYLAEPGQGVADALAVGEHELLTLERGFESGVGNTIRIFRVSLRGATDVSHAPTLRAPGLRPVRKQLLADVGRCPPSGAESPGTQRNPLLDNYEAMTLGRRLPGGARSLLLLSDDNFGDTQVTRVLALRVRDR